MALTEIKTSGIADDAITADKLANAINTERAANTAKVSLGSDAVTGAKIADDAIDSEHYTDGSIDTAHIADNQVTGDKLADDITLAGTLTLPDTITHTGDTNTKIRFPAADTVSVETGGSERMRVDSSGNVGIGTTSPRANLHIQDNGKNALANVSESDNYHLLLKNDNDTNDEGVGIAFSLSSTVNRVGAAIIHKRKAADSIGDLRFYYSVSAGSTGLSTVQTKRGEWKINCGGASDEDVSSDPVNTIGDVASNSVTSNLARLVMQERSSYWISFKNGSGDHYGSIYRSGSNVVYGGTSDYRLKENVATLSDGITKVKALKPITYKWKATAGYDNTDTHNGFLAHEVQSVEPDAVSGVKDGVDIVGNCTNEDGEVTQSLVPETHKKTGETWTKTQETMAAQVLDERKLVPILTAALQEAITKIETLETKVAALEAK